MCQSETLWLPRNRMPELGKSGSVGGLVGNHRVYPAKKLAEFSQ
jgi:hypothetical protein